MQECAKVSAAVYQCSKIYTYYTHVKSYQNNMFERQNRIWVLLSVESVAHLDRTPAQKHKTGQGSEQLFVEWHTSSELPQFDVCQASASW